MASSLISYCGLFCGACSFKIAYETQNQEHINHMPSVYDHLKGRELENCPGCRLEHKCGECEIRDCAVEKKIDYCFQCIDYPCQLINEFSNDGKPHHKEIIKNFELLKEVGEDEWLKIMGNKYLCIKCNKKKSWYYKECDC
jgi:hypothetical protein